MIPILDGQRFYVWSHDGGETIRVSDDKHLQLGKDGDMWELTKVDEIVIRSELCRHELYIADLGVAEFPAMTTYVYVILGIPESVTLNFEDLLS